MNVTKRGAKKKETGKKNSGGKKVTGNFNGF